MLSWHVKQNTSQTYSETIYAKPDPNVDLSPEYVRRSVNLLAPSDGRPKVNDQISWSDTQVHQSRRRSLTVCCSYHRIDNPYETLSVTSERPSATKIMCVDCFR